MDRLLVAIRYLIARPISFVAMLTVVVSVISLVLVDSIMNGFLADHESLLRTTTPAVSVSLPPEMRRDEEAIAAALVAARGVDGVQEVGARRGWASLYRIVSQPRGLLRPRSDFIGLVGLDPEAEKETVATLTASTERTPSFLTAPRAGDPFWFDDSDPYWEVLLHEDYLYSQPIPMVVGEYLASSAGLQVGTVLSIATFGDADADQRFPRLSQFFVVTGTFRTQDQNYDFGHALVRRSDVLRFTGTAERANEFSLGVEPGREDDVANALKAALSPWIRDEARIQTWEERRKVILNAIKNERGIMNFAQLFVVAIAAFGLLVTLSMMVNSKIREIGVLGSMGATPRRVASIFVLCGVLMALVGIAVGLVAGLAITWNLNAILHSVGLQLFEPSYYNYDELPAVVDRGRLTVLVLLTFACAVAATLIPSWRAARLPIVEALRRE